MTANYRESLLKRVNVSFLLWVSWAKALLQTLGRTEKLSSEVRGSNLVVVFCKLQNKTARGESVTAKTYLHQAFISSSEILRTGTLRMPESEGLPKALWIK